MSGNSTPTGGYMRQRHSQGYTSSGDDLEDDACSKSRSQSPSFDSFPRTRTWTEFIENFLWIASAALFVYFGDRNSNLIYLLLHDNRIRRIPLYLGMFGVSLNVAFFLYTSMLLWGVRISSEKMEMLSTSAVPFVTLLGLISFCLFSIALWPIWSFLTLPLVFTLFMACMIILPCFVFGRLRPQSDTIRTD